ncbi:alpha-L-rhamnosidase C-terminal domain-containing protein [Cohnella cellulosilytica]|uniref:Alpha-L-rhamnosidase C-terminal domain-containing protein n=1 Tax=Cohnella cellulosilytica TaxID=986710 RepID=A0ABW2F4C1_9BACL
MEKWSASWIWVEEGLRSNNQYMEARGSFELPMATESAVLRVTANQEYVLFVNGFEIGRGPSPCDNGSQYYDIYEVAEKLRPGRNVVAVLAYNFGTDKVVTGQRQGPGGLLCQVDLGPVAEGGEKVCATATGKGWKCRVSPRWRPDSIRAHMWGGYREIYLADREDGWELPEYDDTDWANATAVFEPNDRRSPWPRLLAREIPHLQRQWLRPIGVIGEMAYLGTIANGDSVLEGGNRSVPMSIDASVPGSYPNVTYDFGTEVVGYPELELEAPEGGVAHLFYGEGLELEHVDTFILKKGSNRVSSFGRRAFRFMKLALQGTPEPVEVRSVRIKSVHYPYAEQGSFVCSDEKLNRIWEVGKYTTIVNSQDHFEDCPHREAALWVADAVVMARVVYQTFGDLALVRKCLLQVARIQNGDGSIPGTGPENNSFTLPDFCAHWLFGVKEYVDYSGDENFLAELWPSVNRLEAWFRTQEDGDGLFANANRDGWWCFIDWSDDIERKDKVTAISCYYYKFLLTVAQLARRRGEEPRAQELEVKADGLRKAVWERMRLPEGPLFADCLSADGLSDSVTAQTNFVAAWCGIMEPEEVKRFIEDFYLAGKLPPIKGAFFYHIVLETLFAYGYREEALKEIRYFWGAMLDRGATTWWETFDPSLPECTVPSPYLGHTPTFMQAAIPVSFSHGWGASPTYLLSRETLGVDTSRLGEGIVAFRPGAVGGLSWARGTIPTPRGDIEASWSAAEGGEYAFEAQLPAGLEWSAATSLQNVEAAKDGERTLLTGTFTAARSDYSCV